MSQPAVEGVVLISGQSCKRRTSGREALAKAPLPSQRYKRCNCMLVTGCGKPCRRPATRSSIDTWDDYVRHLFEGCKTPETADFGTPLAPAATSAALTLLTLATAATREDWCTPQATLGCQSGSLLK